jgi:hypothetical protein
MASRYTHARLLVENYRDCFRFYRDVAGFEPCVGDESIGYADFATGDTTLALIGRSEMAQAVGTSDTSAEAGAQDRAALICGVDSVDQVCADVSGKGVVFITRRPIAPIGASASRTSAIRLENVLEICQSLGA